MLERSIRHAWKACVRETVPRVRIPFSPPFISASPPFLASRRASAARLHPAGSAERRRILLSPPFLPTSPPFPASRRVQRRAFTLRARLNGVESLSLRHLHAVH